MNTCSNCKLWGLHRENTCGREDPGFEIEVEYGYGVDAHLVTSPNFGCIHHELQFRPQTRTIWKNPEEPAPEPKSEQPKTQDDEGESLLDLEDRMGCYHRPSDCDDYYRNAVRVS